MNRDKTKVIKIGASRDRSIPWEGKCDLTWSTSSEVLGIIHNTDTLSDIREQNLRLYLAEIKKLIAVWSTRRLTPFDKVVIIKSSLYHIQFRTLHYIFSQMPI